jgi:hypothetical protein
MPNKEEEEKQQQQQQKKKKIDNITDEYIKLVL